MESKENFEWRNQNSGTNGIYEIDGANTTDGGIVIHGADLSDEIDGAYENNRICVFFIDVMEFQRQQNNGIDATHWTSNTYRAKKNYEADCIDWLAAFDGIEGIESFDGTAGFGGLKQYK